MKVKPKIIKDEKMEYLIKTLSRTSRKDYENYVINSIWTKLDNSEIEIVSQQYINDPKDKRKYYFIDLYFPAVNIGIECDEAHHKNEETKKADKKREASIFDVLNQINREGYIPKHIDVTKPFNEVQSEIDKVVLFIKQKIKEIKPPRWEIIDVVKYFQNKKLITTADRIGFKTINQACNILFSTNYSEKAKGARMSYFTPGTFKGTEYAGYKVWFPKLAIKNEDGKLVPPTDTGWNNQLTNKGKKIIEEDGEEKSKNEHNERRITFVKYSDSLGYNAYKFVGIFQLEKTVKNKRYYNRINENCKLIST
jgi:very-short-patch-repair endonuclease